MDELTAPSPERPSVTAVTDAPLGRCYAGRCLKEAHS